MNENASKTKIFLVRTIGSNRPRQSCPLPQNVDVAVIGAGLTGLSAARTLAKGRLSVAVLESQAVGWGASSRNGGMVLTGLKLPVGKLVDRVGIDLARQMYLASLESIAQG